MKSAHDYIKSKKTHCLDLSQPWTQESDEIFFSKRNRGLASWYLPSGSSIYYEFEGKKIYYTRRYLSDFQAFIVN